jgi:RNA polymerase sigma-70 factor (ECF subfamily)
VREPDSSGEARFRRERADLDALFRAHHAEIVRYLSARLGSRQEADDLAGEVFLAAVGSVPRLRWQGRPVLAWLYRVAGNMAADRVRQRAQEVPTAAPPPEVVAPAGSFVERDALARAMRRLPADQALAVHLRLVEDYSFADVGRLMGRSPAACQMLVLRAARSLQASLREEGIHA